MARRTHPLLASDVARTWVGSIIAVPLTMVLSIVLVAAFRDDLPQRVALLSTLFLGWTLLAATFAILTVAVFLRPKASELRRWMVATTPEGRLRRLWWALQGGGAIYWTLTGTVATLITLVMIVVTGDELRGHPLIVASGISVVVSSFALIVTSYALRYAREDLTNGGAAFPETANPRFADYLYLAVQVSTTFGGSDVSFTTSAMRRMVSVHSLIAFAFNTVIVALLVSVLLNAVS